MEIEIDNLGLAVFIKTMIDEKINYAENTTFINVENRKFIFTSDLKITQWRVKFINHVCSEYDKNLMSFRKFL